MVHVLSQNEYDVLAIEDITISDVCEHLGEVKHLLKGMDLDKYKANMHLAINNKTAYKLKINNELKGFIYLVPYKGREALTSNCLYTDTKDCFYSSWFLSWVLEQHDSVNFYPINNNVSKVKSMTLIRNIISNMRRRVCHIPLNLSTKKNFIRLSKYLGIKEV